MYAKKLVTGHQELVLAVDQRVVVVPESDELPIVVEDRLVVGFHVGGVDPFVVRGDRQPRVALGTQ